MSKPPPSYDEITRKTVPDPDGGMRPSKQQVTDAYDGSHGKDQEEQALRTAVQSAIGAHAGGSGVTLDLRDDQVELRGQVKSMADLDEVEALVRDVPGVRSVTNKLVVAQ